MHTSNDALPRIVYIASGFTPIPDLSPDFPTHFLSDTIDPELNYYPVACKSTPSHNNYP